MPTYDYQCDHCLWTFEVFHGMSEQPEVSCPECQEGKVSRKISRGAGIHFKGSGFYVNDYKKETPNLTSEKKETQKSTADGVTKSDKKDSSKKVKTKEKQLHNE